MRARAAAAQSQRRAVRGLLRASAARWWLCAAPATLPATHTHESAACCVHGCTPPAHTYTNTHLCRPLSAAPFGPSTRLSRAPGLMVTAGSPYVCEAQRCGLHARAGAPSVFRTRAVCCACCAAAAAARSPQPAAAGAAHHEVEHLDLLHGAARVAARPARRTQQAGCSIARQRDSTRQQRRRAHARTRCAGAWLPAHAARRPPRPLAPAAPPQSPPLRPRPPQPAAAAAAPAAACGWPPGCQGRSAWCVPCCLLRHAQCGRLPRSNVLPRALLGLRGRARAGAMAGDPLSNANDAARVAELADMLGQVPRRPQKSPAALSPFPSQPAPSHEDT